MYGVVPISIHPPREGWDNAVNAAITGLGISIHPPREGWDRAQGALCADNDISIHPPREGWDLGHIRLLIDMVHFNPHGVGGLKWYISIHPPREGWDGIRIFRSLKRAAFQSTHPVRGGTAPLFTFCGIYGISIHPPREGWDIQGHRSSSFAGISIHPPREGWDKCSKRSNNRVRNFNPPTP